MLERINSRLVAEGIPAVEMIILKWRMSQLLRDIQRKYGMLCAHPFSHADPGWVGYVYARTNS
jgi:hypothetical protein